MIKKQGVYYNSYLDKIIFVRSAWVRDYGMFWFCDAEIEDGETIETKTLTKYSAKSYKKIGEL